jgi:hypothetical protein
MLRRWHRLSGRAGGELHGHTAGVTSARGHPSQKPELHGCGLDMACVITIHRAN